jgi:hypothetical protein
MAGDLFAIVGVARCCIAIVVELHDAVLWVDCPFCIYLHFDGRISNPRALLAALVVI